jgi:hypothetical protein
VKHNLFLLVALISLTLIVSCSKSDSGPKTISITAVNPEKLYTGIQVTVTGENFGTDTSILSCRLDSRKMVITNLTNSSITFTIPQNFIKSGQLRCALELEAQGRLASRIVVVNFLEPHGWFYPATISNSLRSGSQSFKQLIFPTDSIGYAQRYKDVYRSTDGGLTWREDLLSGGMGLGNAIASSDGINVWIEWVGQTAVTSNGGADWVLGPGNTAFGIIIGLYTTAPATGLMAGETGRLYDYNGSYTGVLKYQSSFYNGINTLWQKMSVFDKNNLIIAGTSKNVVIEKAGVFTEVDISSITTSSVINGVQMIDANTAFLVNGNDELIKYTGNTWTKLTQKANAVFFINTATGYISYNNKILKTTDGGASWKDEFSLNATEKVAAICTRNGKVWALGNDDKQGFVLKYNP